jgi:hypothetical protein
MVGFSQVWLQGRQEANLFQLAVGAHSLNVVNSTFFFYFSGEWFGKNLQKKPFERVDLIFRFRIVAKFLTQFSFPSKHHKHPMFKLHQGVRVKVFFPSFHVAPKLVISHKKIRDVENLEILLNVGQRLDFTS